jgi:hypothetical protein
MKRIHWPILLTTAVTLLSGAVAVRSYHAIEEEGAQASSFTSFSQGKSSYIIRDKNDPGRCVGEGHVLLDYSNNQVSLAIDGWASLRAHTTTAHISLHGTAVFNSLGQLTAMVFYTGIGENKIKFGSTQINPIKFEVYRDTPESPLILRQLFPGPVLLKPKGDLFELALPNVSSLVEKSSALYSPILIEKTLAPVACDAQTAGSFDLSPLLVTADSVTRAIQKSFGGP